MCVSVRLYASVKVSANKFPFSDVWKVLHFCLNKNTNFQVATDKIPLMMSNVYLLEIFIFINTFVADNQERETPKCLILMNLTKNL